MNEHAKCIKVVTFSIFREVEALFMRILISEYALMNDKLEEDGVKFYKYLVDTSIKSLQDIFTIRFNKDKDSIEAIFKKALAVAEHELEEYFDITVPLLDITCIFEEAH